MGVCLAPSPYEAHRRQVDPHLVDDHHVVPGELEQLQKPPSVVIKHKTVQSNQTPGFVKRKEKHH